MYRTFNRVNTSQWVVIALSILSCAVLVWAYRDSVNGFETSHRAVSETASVELASQVSFILKERQRQVNLFAEDHFPLLQKLHSDPENDVVRSKLQAALKRELPGFFAFTISSVQGEPYLIDFDGFVGDVCVQDIKEFSASGQYQARIHPNSHRYHFDVMSKWQGADGSPQLLMVSFEPAELGQLLRAVEQPGHQLMLITNSEPPIIEVTANGARDQVHRDDYRLSLDEQSRILSSHPVEQSGWNVADFVMPGYFAAYHRQVLWRMMVFFAVLLVVIGVSFTFLRREEQRRKAAELAREEVVSMITHELRTPVTAISGTLTLLAHGVLGAMPESMQSSMQLLERNAERLRRLIDDLLESRQYDSGQFSISKEKVDLTRVVADSILHLHGYVSQLNVKIEKTGETMPLWVNADTVRLQQIISNLLSNAAKYSAEGDVVELNVAVVKEGAVRVSVIDHGPGIPAAFQKMIFQKFARGPAPKNRMVASTGLGLCIVKALVDAHGGLTGFHSVEGQGSTFFFELPLV